MVRKQVLVQLDDTLVEALDTRAQGSTKGVGLP